MSNIDSIETALGYQFKNRSLLDQALTTKAYSNEHRCKDQSEFQTIGDAVLKLVLTEKMMMNGNSTRGAITIQRSEAEKKEGLALVAKKLGIMRHIKLGNGQMIQNHVESDHLLAETLEAIAAAIYLDTGFDKTKNKMSMWFDE
jgi:dsRNA-specific ribonuclease